LGRKEGARKWEKWVGWVGSGGGRLRALLVCTKVVKERQEGNSI
jgi:hypothetical protein